MNQITQVLTTMNVGEGSDSGASAELTLLVYDALRRLAAKKLSSEFPGQTLQPTALVHEAYLRLVDGGGPQHWKSRGHFLLARLTPKQCVVSLSTTPAANASEKHGGDRTRQPLGRSNFRDCRRLNVDIVALDDALNSLAENDPEAAELVKLRYFAGFTSNEAAEILGISSRTADRAWNYARSGTGTCFPTSQRFSVD